MSMSGRTCVVVGALSILIWIGNSDQARESLAKTPAVGRRSTPWAPGALTAVLVVALLSPVLYGLVAFHRIDARFFAAPVWRHAAFNTLANFVVMAGALRLPGRFDEKLSAVFRRALVAHGALAFFTLVTRQYYSIPMLLTGGAASIGLGAAVAFLRQKVVRPRVGLVGPHHWIIDDPWLSCETLSDPAASISPYQFLLISFDGATPPIWTSTVSRALVAGKRVRHVSEYVEDARGVTAIEHFDLDHISDGRFAGYRVGKRLLDIALVLIALPLAVPIMTLAAVGIALTTGRPVGFVQSRVGLGGRSFRMLKLRTMSAAPQRLIGATAPQDARITAFGRWLRRFRIDELPQLWNVLIGDMSLIGPRPEQPALAEEYERQTPAFAFRTLVRPGITGWAQVRAPYAANLAETRVKLGYDLFYLKHLSLGLDAQILVRTIWTLLSGGGVR